VYSSDWQSLPRAFTSRDARGEAGPAASSATRPVAPHAPPAPCVAVCRDNWGVPTPVQVQIHPARTRQFLPAPDARRDVTWPASHAGRRIGEIRQLCGPCVKNHFPFPFGPAPPPRSNASRLSSRCMGPAAGGVRRAYHQGGTGPTITAAGRQAGRLRVRATPDMWSSLSGPHTS